MNHYKNKGWYLRPELPPKLQRKVKSLLSQHLAYRRGGRRAIYISRVQGLMIRNNALELSLPYSPISQIIGEVMHETRYDRETVIALLRELGLEKNKSQEVFLYGGCWHGDDPGRDRQLFEEKADFAFFSDITGSDRVEESKRLYYNEIVSLAGPLIASGKLKSFKNYTGLGYIRKLKRRINSGYKKLMYWKYYLEFGSRKKAKKLVANMSDWEIWENVKIIADKNDPRYLKNHGEWLATLPYNCRKKILDMVAEETRAFIAKLGKLKDAGTRVVIVEGNWDRDALSVIAAGNKYPLGKIKKYFNTKAYIRKKGIEYYSTICGIESKTAYHILVPYFWLRKMDDAEGKFEQIMHKSVAAKKEGKSIVIYAHGVPYPEMHDLTFEHPVISYDNLQVAKNLRMIMGLVRPDEVIYPHYHIPMINEKEEQIPHNYHLLASFDKKKASVIKNVKNFGNFGNGNKVAVLDYVPFREVAIKKIYEGFNLPARIL